MIYACNVLYMKAFKLSTLDGYVVFLEMPCLLSGEVSETPLTVTEDLEIHVQKRNVPSSIFCYNYAQYSSKSTLAFTEPRRYSTFPFLFQYPRESLKASPPAPPQLRYGSYR